MLVSKLSYMKYIPIIILLLINGNSLQAQSFSKALAKKRLNPKFYRKGKKHKPFPGHSNRAKQDRL